jgi:hypothetical protein
MRGRRATHYGPGLTEPTRMTSSEPEETSRSKMGSSKDSLTVGRKQSGITDLMKVLKRPSLGVATEQLEEAASDCCLKGALLASLPHEDDASEEKREVCRPGIGGHQRWAEGQGQRAGKES